MASFLTAFCIALLYAFGTTWCFEWETLPEPVVYSCVGSEVTFPWRYRLDDVDLIRDIRWFFNGVFDSEMVGTETYGYFFPTPPYSRRVRQLTNGGLVLSDVTMADAGNYTVEVNVEVEGAAVTHRRSVLLQVGDGLMTEGGTLTAKQDPVALWDSSTHQWVIRLTCGRFTFRGQPPVHVIWTTPTMETTASSGYDNGHFYLTLPSPVTGGNYTCHIPHHLLSHVCVTGSNHGNHTLTGRVLVDEVKVRLSLLEAEQRTLQSDNADLREQVENLTSESTELRQQVQIQDETIRNLTSENTELSADLQETQSMQDEATDNLTHYMREQLKAFREEVSDLWNIAQEQQVLLRGPCNPSQHIVLSDPERAVTNDGGNLCDSNLSPGWYRFVLNGSNAVMPTQCVPRLHCGTHHPMWLDLQGNAMPAPGQQTDARACARSPDNCCYLKTPITVRNCGAYFVYKLTPRSSCFDAFCAQKVDS